MAYHICIDLEAANIPARGAESENNIIHVEFSEPSPEKYKVELEELEPSLLTEYLKKRDGPGFNQKLIKLTFNMTPTDEVNHFCKNVLEKGIFCQKIPHFFVGHSDDQLKKKSCYLMKATHEKIHEHLAKFGDFLEEHNLGKRARKIGMLFSPLNTAVPLARKEYKIAPDIKRGVFKSYTFTDGCGFMSPEFAAEVQNIMKLDVQPSAVQVRFRGIEGMLVLKEDLKGVKVQFHNSMQKFVTPDENMPEDFDFADVVDYSRSRPYVNGYLDTRMVMLLAEAGVFVEHLKELQSDYHALLENICKNKASAECFFRLKGKDDPIKTKALKDLRKVEMDEMQKAAYTRILVPKSRVVFAVCDPYNKLMHGECYFNPTRPDDEERNFLTGQQFVVMQHPCYHPGDVRVLTLTDKKEEYENLRDCLVLPVKGPRPHAFECSGGYLGGDKFFVSWDDKLIPNKMKSPCAYPAKETAGIRKAMAAFVPSCLPSGSQLSPDRRNEEGRREMREYFAKFTDDLTEKIDKTYMNYATAFGPSSKECRKLSKMFYQAANLTEDRVVLEKKWLKLKKTEPRAKSEVSYRDTATLSETSPLLVNAEQGIPEGKRTSETIRQPRLFMGRFRRPRRPGNEVREEINKRAKEFVEKNKREFNRVIV
ncbi:uncharacterized protein LOC144646274 [Oculina patagonica]